MHSLLPVPERVGAAYNTVDVRRDLLRAARRRFPGANRQPGRLYPEKAIVDRDRKLCDMQMALARMGGNALILREVIEMVRADIPEMLCRLRAAVSAGDAAAVEREAHGVAGTVVTFDADAAVAAARRLQSMGHSGDLSQAEAATELLEQEIALLDKELLAEVERQ
jgi:HPt (histidine-containing phosphotransfer) domain-containing protein